MTSQDVKIGWRFDNTYAQLPESILTKIKPVSVKKPNLVLLNHQLSKDLGLNFSNIENNYLASIFSGNILPKSSECIAQAYAGHQFGHFTMLGDGRAIIMGEHIDQEKKRVDIQFKGSGKTPYSRNADGRAALGPMLREYIISEAMHGLKIPTTRSLAVVKTGENVIRETPLQGAILTRVASSHIRVGTFQYIAMTGDLKNLKTLLDYTIKRHYPDIKESDNPALELLKKVIKKQIELVTNWMRVGFVHGVMNTDNMTISGETIDYGPCAFMDNYNPETVFSSIDHHGRYAYCNQPVITKWNLARFAETLLPLINENKEKAIKIATDTVNEFDSIYKTHWINMMRKKLGLIEEKKEDENLINDLLLFMEKNKVDYTNTFFSLTEKDLIDNDLLKQKEFYNWHQKWKKRQSENNIKNSINLMKDSNPSVIPRNHIVEEVLQAAEKDNLLPLNSFLKILQNPYGNHKNISKYQSSPPPTNDLYRTFCGT
tara:strand:+ start:325 stop:1785 length:1461 start_codon:yes stop_codon:yes gene_type:complete